MEKNNTIVVIGDWLIDEHAILGVHRSSLSSRVGDNHYRYIGANNKANVMFCGAGRPASLLYQLKKNQERMFDIVGLGLWSQPDKEILESMFVFNNDIINPYKLNRTYTTQVDGVTLINLVQFIKEKNQSIKDKIGTTRIVRNYTTWSETTSEIKYDRYDYEVDLSEYNIEYDVEKLTKESDLVLSNNKIAAVIIKDMHKGAVTEELIKALTSNPKLQQAEWFVSSKEWKPSWLAYLKNVNLKLLLIPQIAAKRATIKEDITSWITDNGNIDESVYDLIIELSDTIFKEHQGNKPYIMILPEEYSIIAYQYDDKVKKINDKLNEVNATPCKKDIIVQSIKSIHKNMPITGMASIFLAIIVNRILNNVNVEEFNLKNFIKNTLSDTFFWAKNEMKKIEGGSYTKSFEEIGSAIDDVLNFNFKSLSFEDEKQKWKIAKRGIGVINLKENDPETKKPVIDLWRSTIEVEGYVCLDFDKRKRIRQLINELKEFKLRKHKHHMGCMLVGRPGSGKTFLVRKLAEKIGFQFLSFNITQMLKIEDMLNCFETIEIASKLVDKPVLVFIDEINAKMANATIYGAFLSPLEDGKYTRNGIEHIINPCFWLFSGTKTLNTPDSDESDKKKDFMSRLSMQELDLTKNSSNQLYKVENIYIGVSLIKNEYPDVRYISKGVLKYFYYLEQNIGIRDMKHLVRLFTDIKYAKVITDNIKHVKANEQQEELFCRETRDNEDDEPVLICK